MQLILNNIFDDYVKTINLKNLITFYDFEKELSKLRKPLNANLITFNEKINSEELMKLISNLEQLDIKLVHIYSNSRETILTGKSLKINATLVDGKAQKHKSIDNISKNNGDTIYKGTVRSGDRISSNGDLFIVGDVNPGAIVSATKNVYVWGKLFGIAIAGEGGDKNTSIASLYLNPLQLRICDIVALGPSEKPKNEFPEVALLKEQSIVIKPYLIGK